jgi:hypothetical protein
LDLTRLTVSLVEAIQRAIEKGRPVNETVHQLQTATLAGLLEYGTLRYHKGSSAPALPKAIHATEPGRALLQVPCALGLRTDGELTNDLRRLDLRISEFFSVANEADVISTEWENYCGRFERAAWDQGFGKAIAANLQSALYEMATNAVIHASSPVGAIVGYEVANGLASFTVADVGIGVLRSLQSVERFKQLNGDVDAIHAALHSGVSRLPTGGTGFNSVFKALARHWGELRFRSERGCVSMDGLDVSVDKATFAFPPLLPGFQVSVCCRAAEGKNQNPPAI